MGVEFTGGRLIVPVRKGGVGATKNQIPTPAKTE